MVVATIFMLIAILIESLSYDKEIISDSIWTK